MKNIGNGISIASGLFTSILGFKDHEYLLAAWTLLFVVQTLRVVYLEHQLENRQ